MQSSSADKMHLPALGWAEHYLYSTDSSDQT